MPPIAAFIVGVLCSELMQWGLWGIGHPGKPIRGYLDDGWKHFMVAWSVCLFVGVLWALEGLSLLFGLLPDGVLGDFWKAGVPYTPQVGMLLGLFVNFTADKIAFAFRARLAPAPATVEERP